MERSPRDFRKLKVWQMAHELTMEVYRATRSFPREELYGLTSQMRRAASSIPTNIAEGCGRGGETELARFMRIAHGSGTEMEYLVILARDLGLLPATPSAALEEMTRAVNRTLHRYIEKLLGQNGPDSPSNNS